MISFTEAQIVFITQLLDKLGVENGIQKFDEFNRTYKKPVKKRKELEDGVRCVAFKKNSGRCNGRRNGTGTLCGIHENRGPVYGVVNNFSALNLSSPFNVGDQQQSDKQQSDTQLSDTQVNQLLEDFFKTT